MCGLQIVFETDGWQVGCRLNVLASPKVCVGLIEGTRGPQASPELLAGSESSIASPVG